jgi:hypothetical protein
MTEPNSCSVPDHDIRDGLVLTAVFYAPFVAWFLLNLLTGRP